MGSQTPSHHTDVATAMGTGDSFLCDGGGKRLKFEKCFIQPTPLKVCTCNCAKSSKTAATSPMIKPPKNCAFSLCATSRRTGKCLRLSGNRPPINSPSCSVNGLPMQRNSFYHPASHTKFRTLPPPHLCDDWVSAESTTVPERSINPFSRSRALIFENICSRKYTVQRRIVQRFFHRRIRQTEPLLQKVLVRLVCVCAYVTGSGLD